MHETYNYHEKNETYSFVCGDLKNLHSRKKLNYIQEDS